MSLVLSATLVVGFLGASTQINIAPLLGLLLGGGLSSAVTAIVVLRRARTDREETRADTVSTLTKATASWSEYVDDKLDEVLAENRTLRETNLAQRAEIAAANAATAAAEAAAARAEAERSTERHALQNEITARETRIATLERQVAELTDQLASLQAQLGTPARRATD